MSQSVSQSVFEDFGLVDNLPQLLLEDGLEKTEVEAAIQRAFLSAISIG